ncbi:AAA family ATPase [Coleofasciculus sp.]|uniref:AAA family ATPase n=1 Tax=Coleofasciculus sp. TaxID=3100458 RepID=UPI0039F7CB10
MSSPSVPRNAYTDSPEQHPNLILGSLQLFFWLFFHPSAFRNHLKRIDPAFDFHNNRINSLRWGNKKLGKLLFQGYIILPILANLILGLVLLALGESLNEVVPRVAFGVAEGMAEGMAFGVAGSVVVDVLFGVAVGIAVGVVEGVAVGVVEGVAFGIAVGTAFGVARGVAFGVAGSVAGSMAFGVVLGVGFSVARGVAFGVARGVAGGVGVTISLWRSIVTYPFVILWNALLYRLDLKHPDRKCCFLRLHSAFWDEWQRLRLPELDKYLILVLERNPAEGQAALNYLSTTHQGWAAQKTQIELDARNLEHCTNVEEIGKAHRQFTIGEIESPVSSLLRSFDRISKDVNAALNQRSAYNQRLAITAVADRLDSLLRELTRSSEKYTLRFRPIASSWCKIVTNHIAGLAQTVELNQEIDSPYIIGIPLTEQQEVFTGRTSIGLRIEKLILDRRRPPLLLYGQRRMGKTSLLNNLGRLLPHSIIPMFVDLQGAPTSASDHAGFLYNLAKGMTYSAKQQASLTLPTLTREALTDDPFTTFDEWLDDVERVLCLTRCHPCLVQLLCSEIVALKNEQEVSIRRLATVADVEDAVPEALSSGSFFFADIERNQVDELGLAILRFLAAQGEGASIGKAVLSRTFPDRLNPTLNLLLQREFIEDSGGGYCFQVELIRRWFARETGE